MHELIIIHSFVEKKGKHLFASYITRITSNDLRDHKIHGLIKFSLNFNVFLNHYKNSNHT